MIRMRRTPLMLFLLALVFAAPGFLAYGFYTHPHWFGNSTVNKGQFITPVLPLTSLAPSTKWRLVLWQPQECGDACWRQVDQLARIRLALGRRLYNVEVALLTANVDISLPTQLRDADIRLLHATDNDIRQFKAHAWSQPQILLVSTHNAVVLAYSTLSKPGDIFHDLKHLLTQGSAE